MEGISGVRHQHDSDTCGYVQLLLFVNDNRSRRVRVCVPMFHRFSLTVTTNMH